MFNLFRRKKEAAKEADESYETQEKRVARGLREARRDRLAAFEMQLDEMKMRRESLAMQREIAQMEEELAELLDEDDTSQEVGGTPESILAGIAMSAFSKGNNNSPTSQTLQQPIAMTPMLSMSHEQLRQMRDSIPKMQLSMLKTLDDMQIKSLILHKLPNVDEATINRAIEVIRE